MSAAKRINICADDFAQDALRSDAILRLVDGDRISAVSCFSDSPSWPVKGRELRGRASRVQIGLHLNLTFPFGHGERPLAIWLARALTGAVPRALVREHFARQLDRFAEVLGRAPDFVDGHEHVHMFPHVAEIVAETISGLAREESIRVRAIAPFFGTTDAPVKRWVLSRIAERGTRRFDQAHVAWMNTAFAGDYSLRRSAEYPRLFASWLAAAPHGALIMCHPSMQGGSAGERELEFLSSPGFGKVCAAHRILIGTSEGFSRSTPSNAAETGLRGVP